MFAFNLNLLADKHFSHHYKVTINALNHIFFRFFVTIYLLNMRKARECGKRFSWRTLCLWRQLASHFIWKGHPNICWVAWKFNINPSIRSLLSIDRNFFYPSTIVHKSFAHVSHTHAPFKRQLSKPLSFSIPHSKVDWWFLLFPNTINAICKKHTKRKTN